MGAQGSKKRPDVPPPQTFAMSEAHVKRILDAQRREFERQLQEKALITAAELRKNQNDAIIAQKKLQEKAASIAVQRKLQEEAFITAQRKLQEEAAILAAERKLQEETFFAAKRKLQEEAAKAATQRKLQEEALIVAQRKFQEEAFFSAQKKQQEEAAKRALQEEAAKKKQQEEAAKKKQQEEAAKRVFQEEAAKRKQEDVAKAEFQVFLEGTLSAFQEEAAKETQQLEAAKRALQEEVTKRKQQEEAAKRACQEEAAEKKQQEEATKRAFQEKAVKKKQEYTAKRTFQEEAPTSYLTAHVPVPRREPFPSSRSITRPRELPREGNVLRFCSTCCTRSLMKMFKCENGHGSCHDCKIKGRACGICRSGLTNRRSYDIENNVAQTTVPCPHAWQGCVLHIKIADMENHVQECPYKELVCPLAAVFGSCRWLGRVRELSSHFADMHPYLIHKVNSEIQYYLRSPTENRNDIALVEIGCFRFIFHLKISKNDGKVYMAVQLIGTKISAKKWVYEIHVYNKSENHRKYVYTDNCRSSIDNMDDVFNSEECAVLPIWYANTFVNNEALTYKLFIKRTYENRKGFDRNQRGREYSEEEVYLYSRQEKEEVVGNGLSSGSCTSLTDNRDIRQQPRGWVNSRRGRRNY